MAERVEWEWERLIDHFQKYGVALPSDLEILRTAVQAALDDVRYETLEEIKPQNGEHRNTHCQRIKKLRQEAAERRTEVVKQ